MTRYVQDSVSNIVNSGDPVPEKLFTMATNYTRRVVTMSTCCGHDGEAGCCRTDEGDHEHGHGDDRHAEHG